MNKILMICFLLMVMLSQASADYDWADSDVFSLDLLSLPSGDGSVWGDSSNFVLDLLDINRTWADSGSFKLSQHLGDFRGVNYTAWETDAYSMPSSDESLTIASEIGLNWVGIVVWWFQDNINSTVIEPDYTITVRSATPESVVHAIQKCHQLGMNVMLKPQIDLNNDPTHWRGEIVPSAAWFNSYQAFINFWANIAEQNQVELYCVGTELQNTTSDSTSWTDVISEARNYYSGPLIYAANHDNEDDITWWDELDYIGIDAYYSLSDANDTHPNGLKAAWNNRLNTIAAWHNDDPNLLLMDVIFTEVGYQSLNGTNMTPWSRDPDANPLDFQEQADCYEALLSEIQTEDWLSGIFWWNWETTPNAGGMTNPDFTPQNKPAQKVLCKYYFKCDINGDCFVNLIDFAILTNQWLSAPSVPSADIAPEIPDGIVDITDLSELAQHWFDGMMP